MAEAALKATKEIECFYEYSSGAKEVLATGHRRIDSADDPRWDGELMEKPFSGSPSGYLQVAEVTRVDGEIVKKTGICGFSAHMNRAREFMQTFQDLKAAGSKTPWDQERHFRDILKNAEEAKAAGRSEELAEFAKQIVSAIRGPNAAKVTA